jgi:surfactin synthase thioesterase subunit
MTDDLLAEMHPASNRAWAIFGHSMGALLGHAVCRRIGYPFPQNRPSHLFVSGTSAPGRGRGGAISHLPGKQFWEKLSELGGLPDELLASSELREYFEDILRQDFRAVETYEPGNEPLNVPIAVFYGADDMSVEEAESWQFATRAECWTYVFPGGHFFLFKALEEISHRIRQTLQKSGVPL